MSRNTFRCINLIERIVRMEKKDTTVYLKCLTLISFVILGCIYAIYGITHQIQEKPIQTSYIVDTETINPDLVSKLTYGELLSSPQSVSALDTEARETGVSETKELDTTEDLKEIEPNAKPEPENLTPKPQPLEPNQEAPPAPENNGNQQNNNELEKYFQQDLNSYILEVIKTYGNGKYPYLLNTDYENYNGVTTNLYYQDQLLLRAHPSGNRASQCVGITFEVFFKAMELRNEKLGIPKNDFNGMDWQDLFSFALNWYVASGNKAQNNAAIAIEKYGLGRRIQNWEEAKAGDVIDFSRENNTGHTVIFINWIRDNGKIVGLKYWSSQESTNGISYNTEYFNIQKPDGSKYGKVIHDQVYIGRVQSVNAYRSYK